jgi:hypothetical protein
MVEKAQVAERPDLAQFDKKDTPRYYPDGSPENAGEAHRRMHEATRQAGIQLHKGGNPTWSDQTLLDTYQQAYSNPSLQGIRGQLRTPKGDTLMGSGLTPEEAFALLRAWAKQ